MKKPVKVFRLIIVFFVVCAFSSIILMSPFGGSLYAQGAKIKVFIDPGHGGKDPGAVRFGLSEKTANLGIALKLKAKLEAGGFDVVMSRTSDINHTLDEIVSMANSSHADIFLSIHNNASISPYAHGTETYWNANGINGSSQLANLIQSNLVSQIGRANRGVKTANFRVIKYTNMPAALVECAFMSNQTESDLLKTDAFREKCATGLFNAISSFAKGIDKGSGSYSDVGGTNSSGFAMNIDQPQNGATISEDFIISGWAADLRNSPPTELVKVGFYTGQDRNEDSLLGEVDEFNSNVMGSEGILNSGWEFNISRESLNEGENIIYVYSYDKNNNYSTATVRVNIVKEDEQKEDINVSPTASPGGPYDATAGEEITFDGSGSSDSDGEITEYLWDFGDDSTGTEVSSNHSYSEAGTYTVTLTVKDNSGASSASVTTTAVIADAADGDENAAEEEDNNSADQFGVVSNSTNMIGYININVDDLVKIFEDKSSDKVEWARRIAPLYIEYGKLFNMRADIAWAQMCHETGFLEFTGDVSPDQNNFVGIGATGGGAPGDSFATEELGIIAHFAHLAWYYYPDHINEYCSKQYDPRHFGDSHYMYTGDSTLGFLNGRWAPGANYTDKIIQFANQIIQGIGQDDSTETTPTVTAEAGEDRSGNVGDTLTFDASASTISPLSEDTVVSYSWDWDGDGIYDETVQEAVVTHVFDVSGTYGAALKVTAFDNIEATDTVTVTINDINEIPTASPGGPYTATEGEEITFDGSGSSDSDGEIVEYLWDFGDDSTGTEVSPTYSYSEAGTYTVTLTVEDDNGASSTVE